MCRSHLIESPKEEQIYWPGVLATKLWATRLQTAGLSVRCLPRLTERRRLGSAGRAGRRRVSQEGSDVREAVFKEHEFFICLLQWRLR